MSQAMTGFVNLPPVFRLILQLLFVLEACMPHTLWCSSTVMGSNQELYCLIKLSIFSTSIFAICTRLQLC